MFFLSTKGTTVKKQALKVDIKLYSVTKHDAKKKEGLNSGIKRRIRQKLIKNTF